MLSVDENVSSEPNLVGHLKTLDVCYYNHLRAKGVLAACLDKTFRSTPLFWTSDVCANLISCETSQLYWARKALPSVKYYICLTTLVRKW